MLTVLADGAARDCDRSRYPLVGLLEVLFPLPLHGFHRSARQLHVRWPQRFHVRTKPPLLEGGK